MEPLYATFTLDIPIGFVDVLPSWTGVTIVPEGRQSLNIVSVDFFEDRLRYAGCANVCDDSTHWLTSTISADGEVLEPSAGAAVTTSGLHAVYVVRGLPEMIRHAYCPGACQFSGHWQLSSLFAGDIGGYSYQSTPLTADSSGRLHLIYHSHATPSGLRYAECSGVCGDSAAWSSAQIDSVFPFLGTALVTNRDGTNHVAYTTLSPSQRLRYATCTTACTDSASWALTDIDTLWRNTPFALAAVALVVTPAGRLHLAYLSTDTVHYATCAGNCTTAGAWQSVSLGKPSVTVAVASVDTVVYIATSEDHVTLWRCSASCLTPANWQSIGADSARGRGSLAISLDSVGHASVASTYILLQLTHFK